MKTHYKNNFNKIANCLIHTYFIFINILKICNQVSKNMYYLCARMRTKPKVKIQITRARESRPHLYEGDIYEATPAPRKNYFKIYRTNKNGNRNQAPILIPRKDCKVIK